MMRVALYTMSGSQPRDALASVLQHLAADVVCVADSPSPRKLRRVARRAGLDVVTVFGEKTRRAAILAGPEVRVLSTGGLTLPVADRRTPDRAVAQAFLGVGGTRIAAAACQFGPQFEERKDHSDLVLEFLDTLAAPVVFGADFNTSPRGEIPQRFAGRYVDAWEASGGGIGSTYPTPDPSTRRDMLFVSAELAVAGAAVPNDPPVDSAALHRPVLVELAPTTDGSQV
jgi:endonuclease/exonuclease/phosphatase family metal-dependent hydrolase